MAAPEEINADMLAFWNGKGGDIWVARQEHTDITLAPVTDALLVFAAPRAGERVVDIGCGCGAPTLEFARAAGPSGRVTGLDISGPMLAEGERRAPRLLAVAACGGLRSAPDHRTRRDPPSSLVQLRIDGTLGDARDTRPQPDLVRRGKHIALKRAVNPPPGHQRGPPIADRSPAD